MCTGVITDSPHVEHSTGRLLSQCPSTCESGHITFPVTVCPVTYRHSVILCVFVSQKEKQMVVILQFFSFLSYIPTNPSVSYSAQSVLRTDSSQLFNALAMNSDHCINF